MVKNDFLCAFDFSESSLEALKWTLEEASLAGAKVTVLFCYRLIAAMADEETIDLKRNMEREALRKFDEIEKRLLKHNKVPYCFLAEVGFFQFRIETFIQKHKVGLLVMGNSVIENFEEYRPHGFDQFLRDCQVPVVIVPENAVEESSKTYSSVSRKFPVGN